MFAATYKNASFQGCHKFEGNSRVQYLFVLVIIPPRSKFYDHYKSFHPKTKDQSEGYQVSMDCNIRYKYAYPFLCTRNAELWMRSSENQGYLHIWCQEKVDYNMN